MWGRNYSCMSWSSLICVSKTGYLNDVEIMSDINTKGKWLDLGQARGPGNGPLHCQVTVATTSVIGQLQISTSLEASRLASRYRDECMDLSRSFPKCRDGLCSHRDRFRGRRDVVVFFFRFFFFFFFGGGGGLMRLFWHISRSKRLSSRSKAAYRDYFRAHREAF